LAGAAAATICGDEFRGAGAAAGLADAGRAAGGATPLLGDTPAAGLMATGAWHFGHFTVLPKYFWGALNADPQAAQRCNMLLPTRCLLSK
jgi:hypothetical protein